MWDNTRWEFTINKTCQGHFLCKKKKKKKNGSYDKNPVKFDYSV